MPVIDRKSVDTLRDAANAVIVAHERAHGRRPSVADWEALLTATMDGIEIGGIVSAVRIELAQDDGKDDD